MDMTIRLLNNYTNVSLTCETDGLFSYSWERQNGVIPSDSTGMNANTLTFINLQPEDTGNYRCVATNFIWSNESNYATVTISGRYIYLHTKLYKQSYRNCSLSPSIITVPDDKEQFPHK